ncbi:hypothetical protein LEP1GSC074_2887 [Leptospira noguchii str. Hook]|nr:hypothetical protein LEP1GSC074_2887 [Leptospira noguchii str. Hook]
MPFVWRDWIKANAQKAKCYPAILDVKIPLKKEGCINPEY